MTQQGFWVKWPDFDSYTDKRENQGWEEWAF